MKTSLKAILFSILLTLLCSWSTLQAQEPEIKFDHPFQLNAEPMGAFIQDSDGFFWIGTKSGLFKYDGLDVQAYKQGPDSVSDNIGQPVEPGPDRRFGGRRRACRPVCRTRSELGTVCAAVTTTGCRYGR